MAEQGSSSVDPPQKTSDNAGIPPEDLQVITMLYQKCPKLWVVFKEIVDVVDLMTLRLEANEQLFHGLLNIHRHVQTYDCEEDIILFTSVSGFVEKAVALAREILRDKGESYVTEFPSLSEQVFTDLGTRCLHILRSNMLNCTYASSHFSLRLAKTGFLQDLLEDVKHMQHMSVEALERGGAFLLSLGTIHNCCMHPDSAAVVSQMDIVPHITPFLTKRSHNHLIQSIAIAVMSHVAEDDQLHLLAMDTQLLQYILNHTEEALTTRRPSHSNWCTRELLYDLWQLARNDYNKKLMVAQGTLRTLCSVLDPSKQRSDKEKHHAVAIISRLTEDPTNLHICQNYQELVSVLKRLHGHEAKETSELILSLLCTLEPEDTAEDADEHMLAFPHLARLLDGKYNTLSILRMGLVEFALQELQVPRGQKPARAEGDEQEGHCIHALRALGELAADQRHQREIMSRGIVEMVLEVLQSGNRQEQTEAAKLVLTLTLPDENRAVMQIHAGLLSFLEYARQRSDNPELVQLADAILQALNTE